MRNHSNSLRIRIPFNKFTPQPHFFLSSTIYTIPNSCALFPLKYIIHKYQSFTSIDFHVKSAAAAWPWFTVAYLRFLFVCAFFWYFFFDSIFRTPLSMIAWQMRGVWVYAFGKLIFINETATSVAHSTHHHPHTTRVYYIKRGATHNTYISKVNSRMS